LSQRISKTCCRSSLALNAALAFGALSLDLGLLGMAAGAVVGRLAYALGAIVIVARVAGIAPGRSVVSVLWPIAWCALVSGTVNSWLAPHDFRTVMEAISLYLLGVAPVLGALARSLHGFSRRGRAKRVAGTV
jgi:hypothetical protein